MHNIVKKYYTEYIEDENAYADPVFKINKDLEDHPTWAIRQILDRSSDNRDILIVVYDILNRTSIEGVEVAPTQALIDLFNSSLSEDSVTASKGVNYDK